MEPIVAHQNCSPRLIKFFERNPDLFARCDRAGNEKPDGEFWGARDHKPER